MGSSNNIDKQYTNCIKEKREEYNGLREYQQYDDNGNIIYLYKEEPKLNNCEKFIVSDIYGKIYGSIIREIIFNGNNYTLLNENEQIINYIEETNYCCSNIYLFYDGNRDSDGNVNEQMYCSSSIIQESDKYNIERNIAGREDLNGKVFLGEKDADGNILYKINRYYENGSIFQITDINDNEINLSNRLLFNNGFTKIQMVLILRMIFAPHDSY